MNTLKNERGLTLVEVIAAITILMVVLVVVMPIFPQMGLINNHNIERNEAINIAKSELVYWQNRLNEKEAFYQFTMNENNVFPLHSGENTFRVRVNVEEESEFENDAQTQAHVIHIQIIDEEESIISETYGYIFYLNEELL